MVCARRHAQSRVSAVLRHPRTLATISGKYRTWVGSVVFYPRRDRRNLAFLLFRAAGGERLVIWRTGQGARASKRASLSAPLGRRSLYLLFDPALEAGRIYPSRAAAARDSRGRGTEISPRDGS